MNGWRRLYVVIAGITFVSVAVVRVADRPTEERAKDYLTYVCEEAEEARQKLTDGAKAGTLDEYTYERAQEAIFKAEQKGLTEPQVTVTPEGQTIPWKIRKVPNCNIIPAPILERQLSVDRSKWWGDNGRGMASYLIVFTMIYAIGWLLGWIWRGFFPRKLA